MTTIRPGGGYSSTSSSSIGSRVPIANTTTTTASTPLTSVDKAILVAIGMTVTLLITFGVVHAFEAALFGAAAGLVSAWLQRGLRLRSKFGLGLSDALITSKFWEEAPSTALAQIVLGTIAGLAAGGVAGWMGMPIGAYGIGAVLGGGAGGGSSGGGVLLLFILAIIIVCIIVYLLLNPVIGHAVLTEALKAGIEAVAAKSVVSLMLHRARDEEIDSHTREHLRAGLLWPSAIEGACSGAVVCLVLLLVGLR